LLEEAPSMSEQVEVQRQRSVEGLTPLPESAPQHVPTDVPAQGEGRLQRSLEELARRPWLLWLVTLALNAVTQPYPGIIHDARLYGLQVLNRVEDGALAHDLFLRYGSQDQYSVFSIVAAPLATWIGIPGAFVLLYLLSRALFLYGMMRLVLQLFGTSPWTVATVLVLAVDPVSFGGYGVFQVNEAFMTPRLPAVGLAMLGLAWMLRGHYLVAAGLFFLGCLLHPLMAVVGFPLLIGWLVVSRWPQWGLLGLTVVALLGCAIVLGIPPIGYKLFGYMDPEWLDQVCLVTTFNFPFQWCPGDYRLLAFTVLVVGATAVLLWRENRPAANFLGLTLLAGLGGLLATTVSSGMGYRILFQGQPYRALWLVHLLSVPCAILLLVRAWQSGQERTRILTILGVSGLLINPATSMEVWLVALFLPPFLCGLRGLQPRPNRPDWLSCGLAASVAAALIVSGFQRVYALHAMSERMQGRFDDMEVFFLTMLNFGVVAWALVSLALLRVAAPQLISHPVRIGSAALALFLALHLGCFAFTQSPWYRGHHMRQGENVQFVADVLAEQHRARVGKDFAASGGSTPTIYWTTGQIEVMWLQLHMRVYYHFSQMAGILYSKETAAESFRRARLVGPFEIERYRRVMDTYPDYWREPLEILHGVKIEDGNPSAEALRALAADPLVDYVIVDRDLGEPCLASNGHIYIYDCRTLRARASNP
jgi:hypothetical protein